MNDKQTHAATDTLQEQIFDEAHNTLGAVGFERWKNPKFVGELEDANARGTIVGKCGDTMHMYLVIEEGIVSKASYATDGCASSNICGSFAAEMAIGKTIEELFDLTGDDVLQRIGRFPEDETHCAFLAIKTVQEAANDYMVRKTRAVTASRKA
ncbi:MAG: iron-sulfur cluster assembly scaffold protein [Desulfobulbus propionicus]|nr:MAG: iron-sulfur cluster assembly scaffold protein [Desulfobulbus propionicus]